MPKKKMENLSRQELETFRMLYPVMSDRLVAARFGVAPSTVMKFVKRLGLAKNRPTFLRGNNCKRVLQLSAEGMSIKVYNNTKEAAMALGRKYGYIGIREACRGVRSMSYGFKWKYYETSANNKN